MNFVKDWCSYISAKSPEASEDLAECSALFMLSAISGRSFSVFSQSKSGLYQNEGENLCIWIIARGKSRVTHKTTVSRYVIDILNQLISSRAIVQSFSPEGLIHELSLMCESQTIQNQEAIQTLAWWLLDEAEDFYQNLEKKDYTSGSLALLKRLHDGVDVTRVTKGGKDIVKGPYVPVLQMGTLGLADYFTKPLFQNGYFNRFTAFPRLEVAKKQTGNYGKQTNSEEEEQRKVRDACLSHLKMLLQVPYNVRLAPQQDVAKRIEDLSQATNKKILSEDLGFNEGWYASVPDFTVKIAALHRIGRAGEKELDGLRILQIAEEDFEYALSFMKKCMVWMKEVEELVNTPKGSKYREQKTELDYVMRYIQKAGVDGILRSKLTAKCQNIALSAADVDRLTQSLIAAKKIVAMNLPASPKGGEGAILYRVASQVG